MAIDPITALLDAGKTIVNKIWPDAESKQQRIADLEKLAAEGRSEELAASVQLLTGQLEINKAEAAHPNLFVSGWRPAIGWIGAASLGLIYIPKALFMSGLWLTQSIMLINGAADVSAVTLPEYPDLGAGDVIGLLGSMLGIGAMRSYDKSRGVDTKRASQ